MGPSRRVNHSTAPPGPIAPPPLTVPLTVVGRCASGAGAAATGGASRTAAAPGATGVTGAPGGPPRWRWASASSGDTTRATSGGRLGTLSSNSQSCAARAKSPASYACRPPAIRFRIRYWRSTSVLNARSCGVLTAIGNGSSRPGVTGSGAGATGAGAPPRAAGEQDRGNDRVNHHAYTTEVVNTLFSTLGAPASSWLKRNSPFRIKDPQSSSRSPAVTRATVIGRKPSNYA